MNQILSVETKKKSKNNNSKGPIDIKKIIIFFVIILLIFGLVIAGKEIIPMLSRETISSEIPPQVEEATVTASKQNNQLIVTITHKKEITKVLYNWNGGNDKEIQGDGSNYLEATIDMPSGNNTINITTIDVEGNESVFTKEFLADPNEPQLTLEEAGTNIKIKAKDNERLTLITYRWDEEEETVIEIPEDSSAQIEKEIPIKLGNHTLTVVVVNSKNKQITKTQEVKAIREPEVTIDIDQTDKSYVILTAVDKVSLMKEMIFYINGKGYKVPETEAIEDGTKIQWRFQVEPGVNEIKLTGINKDELEKTVTASYNYIQQ